ncbi:NADP oxidoreductase [Agromyces protaetiae]|uniref:NADP oxidoreductase n=1 Tax=Agromyces protaetiae TaxID=2509455 RepID=A0A4P6FUV7_9MICO|nr:NAD(P)-binding domain-containing protein [Agromyces protaetiae]QAY74358.1 NADP oxidoreductase [Agromyces protaetiae]
MTSIALIGPGRHGLAIANLFASHGVDVVLYHYKPEKARAAAAVVRAHAADGAEVTVADTLADAVAGQEFVVLATLWNDDQRAVVGELGDALVGKIVLDISNPFDRTPQGFVLVTPHDGSTGRFLAKLLPAGAGHVKVFSSIPNPAISGAADQTPPSVLPFLADSQATAERVRPLLEQVGWRPWLVGDISDSRELEVGGRFHVMSGRRGRAVLTPDEMTRYAGPEGRLAV